MTARATARVELPPAEEWCTDGVVIWRKPGGPTVCALVELTSEERAYHARLICAAPRLLRMLDECAARLETCAIHDGSAPEYAALAVSEYRDLIRQVSP